MGGNAPVRPCRPSYPATDTRTLLAYRIKQSKSIEETLFVLTTLGDDRTVLQTYAAGNKVHDRD